MRGTAAANYIDSLAPRLGGRSTRLTGREPEISGLRRLVTPPLVVHLDDEPFMRKFTAITLAHHGYHYRGFADGDEALHYCLGIPPRLLISDVMHPGIWGPTLLEEMHHTPAMCGTRLMMLTAYTPTAMMLHELQSIDVLWMSKPFQMLDLLAAVSGLIGAGVPRPANAPSLAETFGTVDWDSDDIYPPFLAPHTRSCAA